MIYSKQLAVGDQNTPGTPTLYTTPAGITTVVRDIQFMATTPGDSTDFYLYMAGHPVLYSGVETGWANFHWEGRWVLNPGDEIELDLHAGTVSFLLSGYELS